ncbi:MAG TPA: proton-conducting transporter membrane subunit [Solirubrobacteraceae bacterium]|nr:proton-conducting transporter membrane subunit [Solirubrobacteraceae bacterium]
MTLLFALAMGALALAPLLALAPGLTRRGGPAAAGSGGSGRIVGSDSSARPAALCSAVGCVLLVIVGLTATLGGARPILDLGGWLGFGASALRADGLAGIFLTLTGLTGAAVSFAYAGLPAGRWLTGLGSALLLFVAVAIGSDNAFLFLLAWEAVSVCVYLIASAGRGRANLLAGYLTGGLAKVGGAALLAAFGLLYAHTHSFSLAVWTHASLPAGTRGVLFALLLVCFATKVGVVPLQGGLPAGYGSAPRLGAASLSVALCAGFYGLWRFEFQVLGPLPVWCGDALLILGAATALAGIVYALTQDDLRRFLGYSTVEHAGIVLAGLGVALLGQAAHNPTLAAAGLLAATLQACAHNLAKTLALIAVDRVEQATGERTLDPLGGLSRRLPASALALGACSLTLAAIPPLGGFVSEWFILEALLQGFRMPTLASQLLCALAAAALALTAGLGLLAFAKYYGFIFLGPARSALGAVREPSRWPLGLLSLGVVLLFLGTVAPWEIHALGSGLQELVGFNVASTAISHPLVLGPVFKEFSVLAPTWLSIVLPAYALSAVALARAARGRSVRASPLRRAPVWVTGAGAELAAVQYRPSAYSNPMRVILRGPLGYRTRLTAAPGPDEAPRLTLDTRVVLAVDRFLYAPVTALALGVAARVRALQSGRLSAYLLYMLIALIAALALVPILR